MLQGKKYAISSLQGFPVLKDVLIINSHQKEKAVAEEKKKFLTELLALMVYVAASLMKRKRTQVEVVFVLPLKHFQDLQSHVHRKCLSRDHRLTSLR